MITMSLTSPDHTWNSSKMQFKVLKEDILKYVDKLKYDENINYDNDIKYEGNF